MSGYANSKLVILPLPAISQISNRKMLLTQPLLTFLKKSVMSYLDPFHYSYSFRNRADHDEGILGGTVFDIDVFH